MPDIYDVAMVSPSQLQQERALYKAWYAKQPVKGEHDHARLKDTAKLYATCVPCGEKRIRRMAAQPAETHKGRLGRQMAEIYGVRL